MSTEIIIGTIALFAAIAVSTGLIIWSFASIRRIYRKGYGTARSIMKERHRE